LVAKAHYPQVTEADFQRAAGRGAESGALLPDSDIRGALARWLERCPVALDETTRAGIVAMVGAACSSDCRASPDRA
jgi:hypothetical protein